MKEMGREYYNKNKEIINERNKAWQKTHREECRHYWHNRRAKKIESGGTLSKNIIQILWKRQKGKCAACKADLKETGFHLDHIVPLIPRKGEPAGKHEDANMQLTCPTCNQKKHNKNPIQFMREMGYLL